MRMIEWTRTTFLPIALFSLLAACGGGGGGGSGGGQKAIPGGGNASPKLNGQPVTATQQGELFSFVPTAQDADGDALRFSVENLPAWAHFNTATGELSGIPGASDVGTHRAIVIKVSDGRSEAALGPFDLTVVPIGRVVNRPPTIDGDPALAVTAGKTFDFVPTASDRDGDVLRFSIENKPSWATFDAITGRLTGTPGPEVAGVYPDVVIAVTDGDSGAALAPFAIAVNVAGANAPPEISGNPATSVTQGAIYSFTPTASDSDGDALTFDVTNAPSWASFDAATGQLRGTPDGGDIGVYNNVSMTVTDGQSHAVLPSFAIVVIGLNTAPAISGTAPAAATVGAAYSFRPSVQDADGDPLTFAIQNRPSWASFDAATGVLQGMPASPDIGTHGGIVISVSDGTETASLPAFSITVGADSVSSISDAPPATVVEGSGYDFTPVVSGLSGALTFSVAGLPSWATFDTSTGRIQGAPGPQDVGTYTGIQITVSDGVITTTLPAFDITVTATGSGSVTLSWQAPTQNEDGTPLTDLAGYRISWGSTSGNYPQSVTIDNPGITTYMVENLGSGTYYFVVQSFNSTGVLSSYSAEVARTIP